MQTSKKLLTSATVMALVVGIYVLETVSTEAVMMRLDPPAAGKSANLWAHVLQQEEEQAWLREQHDLVRRLGREDTAVQTEVPPEI